MDRRAFLGGMAGMGALMPILGLGGSRGVGRSAGLLAGTGATSATAGLLDAVRGVDAHCHIFNASDLSIGPFIAEVEMKANPGSPLGKLLGKPLSILQRWAPSAREEIQWLDRRDNWAAFSSSSELMSDARTMQAIDGSGEDSDRRFKGAWEEIAEEAPEAYDAFFESYASLQAGMAQQAGATDTWLLASKNLGAAARRNPETFNYLVTEELSPKARTVPLLSFIKTFVRHRYENAMTLSALHGGTTKRKISLFTPAMVDFDLWIGPAECSEKTPSSVGDQVELSAHIATRTDQQVRCLAPFNPLRAITDPTYFTIIEQAVTKHGCLGFKVYPPMGFAPFANADGLVRNLDCKKGITGAMVDEMMERFFALCAQHRIPILAHGSPSNAPGGDAAKLVLGGPQQWEKAFLKFPAYFGGSDPAVRVCIGHFGGISTPAHTHGWADRMADMMGKYSCLYTDTGYFDGFLSNNSQHGQLLARMSRVLAKPAVRQRMMYGSDWSMLAKESGAENYPDLMEKALDALKVSDADKDSIFVGNAFRFYDLKPAGKGRQRFLSI